MYYIYKYVSKGKIFYIGKTKNLKKRIYDHTRDIGFGDYDETKIYYSEYVSSFSADAMETLLINKYRPKLNKDKKTEDIIKFEEPSWKVYSEDDFIHSGRKSGNLLNRHAIHIDPISGIDSYLRENNNRIYETVSERSELIENINLRTRGKLIRNREKLNYALDILGFKYEIQTCTIERYVTNRNRKINSAWKLTRKN